MAGRVCVRREAEDLEHHILDEMSRRRSILLCTRASVFQDSHLQAKEEDKMDPPINSTLLRKKCESKLEAPWGEVTARDIVAEVDELSWRCRKRSHSTRPRRGFFVRGQTGTSNFRAI